MMARIGTGNIRVGSAIAHGTGKKYEIYNTSPRPEPSIETAVEAPSDITQTMQAPTQTPVQTPVPTPEVPPRPGIETAATPSFMDSPIMQERNKFEQYMLQKYDVPISMGKKEISKQAVQKASEVEPELFDHVFGGQFRYEDRNQMPLQFKAAWNHAKLVNRKYIQDKIIDETKQQIDAHKERMKVFDNQIAKLPVGYLEWMQNPERYKQFKDTGRQGTELTPYQELALKKDLVGIEQSILTDKKQLEENPESINVEVLQQSIDFFNEHTDKNYRYRLLPEYGATWSGKETVTYKLKRVPKSKEPKTTKKTMTDEEIKNILESNNYDTSPENIKIFRKNNGLDNGI